MGMREKKVAGKEGSKRRRAGRWGRGEIQKKTRETGNLPLTYIPNGQRRDVFGKAEHDCATFV